MEPCPSCSSSVWPAACRSTPEDFPGPWLLRKQRADPAARPRPAAGSREGRGDKAEAAVARATVADRPLQAGDKGDSCLRAAGGTPKAARSLPMGERAAAAGMPVKAARKRAVLAGRAPAREAAAAQGLAVPAPEAAAPVERVSPSTANSCRRKRPLPSSTSAIQTCVASPRVRAASSPTSTTRRTASGATRAASRSPRSRPRQRVPTPMPDPAWRFCIRHRTR